MLAAAPLKGGGASYITSATGGTKTTSGSDTHVSKLLLIHNGTDVTITEQNTLSSSAYLASYFADINEGNIRLLVTPASASSTTVRVVATAIKS